MNKHKTNPLKSIRKYCVTSCMNNQPLEVRLCPSDDCPLFPLRFGKRTKRESSLRAIRKRCLDCTESPSYTKNCPFTDCHLFPYRMGHNPARRGIGQNIVAPKKISHSAGGNKQQIDFN